MFTCYRKIVEKVAFRFLMQKYQFTLLQKRKFADVL